MKLSKRLLIVGSVFILLLSVTVLGAVIEYQRTLSNEKSKAEDTVGIVTNNIKQMIASRMINAKVLSNVLENTDEFSDEDFGNFAKNIYESEENVVKDVVLITDTTITNVYPEVYGKDAIGVDLASIPEQRDVLLYSKDTGNPVFIGPVDLVEGGQGIIIRVPFDINGTYYGQSTIVFDYEQFLRASSLLEMASDYYISLKGTAPMSNDSVQIWGNHQDAPVDPITEEIELESIIWTITAWPKAGWNTFSFLFIFILLYGFFISITLTFIVNRQINLRTDIMKANASLQDSVIKLENNKKVLEMNLAEIATKEKKIRYQADHDALTGLENRRVFISLVKDKLKNKLSGTAVLIDLDNFKNINDSYGHAYGDHIIISCSEVIQEIMADTGKVFRFGGDEFLLLLNENIPHNTVTELLSSISRQLENLLVHNRTNHITVSSGIVHFPEDSESVEDLLIKADIAMYNAKYSGKNRFVFFDHSMLKNFDYRLKVETALREAIDQDGFTIHYQPIIDINTMKVSSFEALLRLKNNKYGPAEFISIAEETNMIIAIGYQVLEKVARQLRYWLDSGYPVKPVAVNLSAMQLLDISFEEHFFKILNEHQIPISLIHLEITESVLLENETANIELIKNFRNQGIEISMDDFGTGYSSLNYLTFIPMDKLKLDKSLKDKFLQLDPVIIGLIHMSHGLGIKVVAEGVETVEEYEKLKKIGCDYLQGYLFSRPLPATAAIELLEHHFSYF